MADTLAHRGPDDTGVWIDAAAGVALGHRRLAVIDLTTGGHQPMVSACGRYVGAYNGEIYNFQELRQELERRGHVFRGSSDTEVLVEGLSEWGIANVWSRLNGMFAAAVWDRRDGTLTLSRDRFGQKPLYYAWAETALLFGSELRALLAFPGFAPDIDRDSLTLLLRRGCIPAPHTIYEGVYKLRPGTRLSGPANGAPSDYVQESYWTVTEAMRCGASRRFDGTPEEAVASLDEILRDAIRGCMVADVPLGAFLSGGVDSSTVVAMLQQESSRPVHTFAIGFREQGYDEAPYAARVAEHLGTDHREQYVGEHDALDVIRDLPAIYDEPFADPSQIPTVLVARLAREDVTVALSGDGGDEVFCGYAKYTHFDRIRHAARLPRFTRRQLATALRGVAGISRPGLGQRLLGAARILEAASTEQHVFGYLASIWKDPAADVVLYATEPPTALTSPRLWPNELTALQAAMATDMNTYLADDILVKVDRAAMSVGLETRIPFLDHRVLEFVSRLPISMSYRSGQGKLLLRSVLGRYLPESLFDRPKQGFSLPLGRWLRIEMRQWAEDLLDEADLRAEGFFAPQPIRRRWKAHMDERSDESGYLWPVLMFQAWKRAQR